MTGVWRMMASFLSVIILQPPTGSTPNGIVSLGRRQKVTCETDLFSEEAGTWRRVETWQAVFASQWNSAWDLCLQQYAWKPEPWTQPNVTCLKHSSVVTQMCRFSVVFVRPDGFICMSWELRWIFPAGTSICWQYCQKIFEKRLLFEEGFSPERAFRISIFCQDKQSHISEEERTCHTRHIDHASCLAEIVHFEPNKPVTLVFSPAWKTLLSLFCRRHAKTLRHAVVLWKPRLRHQSLFLFLFLSLPTIPNGTEGCPRIFRCRYTSRQQSWCCGAAENSYFDGSQETQANQLLCRCWKSNDNKTSEKTQRSWNIWLQQLFLRVTRVLRTSRSRALHLIECGTCQRGNVASPFVEY